MASSCCMQRASTGCRLTSSQHQPAFRAALARPYVRHGTSHVKATPPGGEELSALQQDLERFKSKSAQASSSGTASPDKQEAASTSPFVGVKETIDKVLIADFFVVLFALAWLAVGVVLANTSGTGSSPVLDAWYPLWPTLWQSAIGLLMAGALVSGGLGWLASQQQK